MGYDDNYSMMVSEISHSNKRSIHSTGDSISHLPWEFFLVLTNDKKGLQVDLREAG